MTLREIRIHPNCIKFVDFHNLHLHLYKVYLIFSVFYTCTSYIITNNNQSYNIIIVHVGTCISIVYTLLVLYTWAALKTAVSPKWYTPEYASYRWQCYIIPYHIDLIKREYWT